MKRTINYGKHAAGASDRKVNEVTLTVYVEPSKYYDPKTKKDYVNGEHFSVSGDVWNASHTDIIRGGQCVDDIIKHYAKDENSRNIRALWEVFHLQQMDAIPERFRTAIVAFVSGTADNIPLERKRCAAYLLKVTEKVTDYGTYTEGTITVKTPDGITEVITLGQGDEIKRPITERAHKVINWLYTDAPTIEDLSRTAEITTNAKEHAQKQDQKRTEGIAEIKTVASRIIEHINTGNVGEKWSVALHEIKYAEKFLTEEKER
jgi:hypothetical protein